MKISALFAALLLLAASAAAQTSQARVDTLKPGSNLVVQGVPPIPNELVAAVKKYTEAIPVGFGDWHPTRREMLVGKRAGNTGQVHIVTSPLATPRQLTDFPDPAGGGSFQPKSGDFFTFFKATGGNEISQMYRYDTATG
ncbi:MAG: S9 family peptidase, partial [Acidobacteria bacterium]|nr:S9 family peptidase [Acidobacteriota bacterium]